MNYLRNVWYMAAWPEEIDSKLIARKILGVPVVMFRREDGSVAALSDACPHRFAPLSLGALRGDVIECRYHGLRFGADGRCALNPHGRITPRMRVEAYPVLERHGIVWIWMGDSSSADPALIPELEFMAPDPVRRTVHHYFLGAFACDLLIDNLMDLSHTDYLHSGSFSGGIAERVELTVAEVADEVVVERTELRGPPPPGYEHMGELVDITWRLRWHPSQVVAFERIITPDGRQRAEGFVSRFCHLAAPETTSTTHYFHAITRTDRLVDPEVDASMKAKHETAIVGEDGNMLRAVQERMGGMDLMDLDPVMLPPDEGAMHVRNVMLRRLAAEALSRSEPCLNESPVSGRLGSPRTGVVSEPGFAVV